MTFQDIFARHRFDIGINIDFKVKLTPIDESPAYSQSLPTKIDTKKDIPVELAWLHKYGIITTLPFSKYASPIFAQSKPNSKLRLLVDLRKNNNLISDDHINNYRPVSTLTDAAKHIVLKNLFYKLDFSQAYHYLQMAEKKSVERLVFIFASRMFAYRRLTQGLNRSLSIFSSFLRELSDPVVRTDQCAQYVADIGSAANLPVQLTTNLRRVFECIHSARFSFFYGEMSLWNNRSWFPWTKHYTKWRHLTQTKNHIIFGKKSNCLALKKALKRYIAFLNYNRIYIPHSPERLETSF